MGNLPINDRPWVNGSCATINQFFTKNAWIEGKSLTQLEELSKRPGVLEIAAFPDLHPGKYGPVGCAVLSERIYPLLIGNDIGCGMSIYRLPSLLSSKLKIDKAVKKLRQLELLGALDGRGFGTIGGGNHFCELQQVVESVPEIDLAPGDLVVMVHCGSRSMGAAIFASLPNDAAAGFDPTSEQALSYVERHHAACRFASANRLAVAQRAADLLGARESVELVADNAHNVIEPAPNGGGLWLHRKGSAQTHGQSLVPLAGSRETDSFLLQPSTDPLLQRRSLWSLPHGAGRKVDRASMMQKRAMQKSSLDRLRRPNNGNHVICDEREKLIQEAGAGFKNVSQVLEQLETLRIATSAVRLRPLITYKTAQEKDTGMTSSLLPLKSRQEKSLRRHRKEAIYDY